MRLKVFTFVIALMFGCITQAQEEIVFVPQWTAQSQFAGYYVALEKGFYKKEGLRVRIEHPYASNSCINLLKAGKCHLITHHLTTAMCHIDNGIHLVNVQQTSQNSNQMIISHKPIRNIQSLNGMRIGRWKAGFFELAMILEKQHKLGIEWIPFIQNVNLFVSGAIDATLAMKYNEYIQLKTSGIRMPSENLLYFSEIGYNVPEDGLYTTQEYYMTHQKEVERFVKATREGWEWAAAHPEETIDIVMNMTDYDDVKTNKLVQRWMLREYLNSMIDKKTGKRTYKLEKDALKLANNLLLSSGFIKKPVTYQQIVKP